MYHHHCPALWVKDYSLFNCIALFTFDLILLLFEVKPVLIISDLSTFILNGVEYFLVRTDNVADKIFSLSASIPASPVAAIHVCG